MLAAGRGERMGGPKALLDVNGRPWWMVQAERLGSAGVAATWVVSEQVSRAMTESGNAPERMVAGDSGAPMIASIVAGLRSLAERPPLGVFVLPVDTPAAGSAVWEMLSGSETVAAPSYEGAHGHPVYLPWAWVMSAMRGPVVEGAGTDGLRLDALIGPSVRYVPVTDAAVAINLNTREELVRYLKADRG